MQYNNIVDLKINLTIDKKLDYEELLKPRLQEKNTIYLDRDCKCCGHDPKCKNCYCLCSCTPWCTKFCYKRDDNKPFYINTSDINENIYYEYTQKLIKINSIENDLVNDFKNHKITLDEFREKNDEIQKLKKNFLKNN